MQRTNHANIKTCRLFQQSLYLRAVFALTFVMAPMVHWPEVMVSYESSEKILFSADGFGKFGALDTEEDWACEARRYYFNIVGKYGAQVQALLCVVRLHMGNHQIVHASSCQSFIQILQPLFAPSSIHRIHHCHF
mgnify:CR=1 FL=1